MGLRHLGLKEESAYGTEATPDMFFEVVRTSGGWVSNFDRNASIRTASRRDVAILNALWRQDVEMVAEMESISWLLYLFYGVDPTTSGGGPYTHTFPPTAGLAATGRIGVSATLEQRDGSLNQRIVGCKMPQMAFRAATDSKMLVTCTFIGKGPPSVESPATATYLAYEPIRPKHINVTLDGTTLKARSLSLNLNWPLDEPHGLGSTSFLLEPDDSDNFDAIGQVEIYTENFTDYAKYIAETDVDVAVVCNNGAGETLTFNIDRARLTEFPSPLEGRARNIVTLGFEGQFNTTATECCQVVVVNNQVGTNIP